MISLPKRPLQLEYSYRKLKRESNYIRIETTPHKEAHTQGQKPQFNNRTHQRGRYILLLGLTGSVGPLLSRSARPRSFHAGSLVVCTALAIPNAAAYHTRFNISPHPHKQRKVDIREGEVNLPCWSGMTSSSSSGLIG